MPKEHSSGSKKAWYLLHSWCGILVSLLLYVVFISGCFVLFFHELQPWLHPELRQISSQKEVAIDFEKILSVAKQKNLITDEATLQLPHYSNAVVLRIPGDVPRIAIFEPEGALVAVKPEGFIRFLRQFHTDLLLPFPYGAYLVGLMGILLLFLICTGIVMHRHFYREMFILRLTKNWRLAWSDIHKLFGGWGLIFQSMMGFTGAMLGLAGVLLLQTAIVAYQGNTEQALESLVGKKRPPSGEPAGATQYAKALSKAINGDQFIPRYVTVRNIGDRNATITVEGEQVGYLNGTERKIFDNNGNLTEIARGMSNGAGWRIYSAMLPLHFGDYAGIALKFIYLILGIGATLMPATGMLLWLERRGHNKVEQRSYRILNGIAVGITTGSLIAIASCFVLAKLAPSWLSTANAFAMALFGGMAAATTLAMLKRHPKEALPSLILVSGILFIGAALINEYVAETYFWHALTNKALTIDVGIDISFLLIGGLLLVAAFKLSTSQRAVRQ